MNKLKECKKNTPKFSLEGEIKLCKVVDKYGRLLGENFINKEDIISVNQ